MSAARRGAEHGSAAEEAARLADALGDWLADRATGLGAQMANGSSECRLCPLCQLIAAVRASRPELVTHLDDATGSVLAALRVALEVVEAHRGAHSPRGSGFEHIDIT